MRLLFWVGLICWFWLPWAAYGEGADDVYIRIYHLIEQADVHLQNGQTQPAYDKFSQSLDALQRMQKAYPNWNNKLIQYRINYVNQRLNQLPAPPKPSIDSQPLSSKSPVRDTPVETGNSIQTAILLNQIQELTNRVRQLESDKQALDAKLREALLAQPAAVDPRELSKAENRVRILQKENDLLKVSLEQEKDRAARMTDPEILAKTQKALQESNRKYREQVQNIESLTQEKKILESRLRSRSDKRPQTAQQPDDAALKRQAQEIAQQKQLIDDLQRERDELRKALAKQAQPEMSRADRRAANRRLRAELDQRQTDLKKLRSEKHALEKQLAQLQDQQEKGLTRAERRELAEQRRVARDLESKNRALEKQMAGFKEKLQELETAAVATQARPALEPSSRRSRSSAESRLLRDVQRERDDLRKKLDTALRAANAAKTKPDTTRFLQTSNQLAALQARLDVLNAAKVPYSAEELALMKVPLIPVLISNTPPSTLSEPASTNTAPPPSGAIPLIAQAQRAFAAGRFDEAEASYIKVLSLDPNSVITIGNLAAIHIEQKKFAEAEAELKKALDLDANDAYCLQLLGILRFRQERYDDALSALSQSAKLDPKSAETQNYLGITLSEKGFRDAAEAALRRSIQLDPQNANAHHNLAVIYATQTPPFLELARWHYQKALSAGHNRNLEMEKVLTPNRPPEEPKP